jgi:hypothetical protein
VVLASELYPLAPESCSFNRGLLAKNFDYLRLAHWKTNFGLIESNFLTITIVVNEEVGLAIQINEGLHPLLLKFPHLKNRNPFNQI